MLSRSNFRILLEYSRAKSQIRLGDSIRFFKKKIKQSQKIKKE